MLLVFTALNHSGVVNMLVAATPRIPVEEKSPPIVLSMLARVCASAFTGFTPSTAVSMKHTLRLRLLCAASFCPARSLLPSPGVMAPRVIAAPRAIASDCTSFTLKRTKASLLPPWLAAKSSSEQEANDNAIPPTTKADST